MSDNKEWYVRSDDGAVYGPASLTTLVEWVKDGRIEPTGYVSKDRITWVPTQLMPELEMKWLIETEPGKFFGPFNRTLVIKLATEGKIPKGASVYRRHDLPVDKDPAPVIVEKIVEKVIEVEPPARTALVVPEVVEAIDTPPPNRFASGIFKGANPEKLAALETAVRRELTVAKQRGRSLGGLFGGGK